MAWMTMEGFFVLSPPLQEEALQEGRKEGRREDEARWRCCRRSWKKTLAACVIPRRTPACSPPPERERRLGEDVFEGSSDPVGLGARGLVDDVVIDDHAAVLVALDGIGDFGEVDPALFFRGFSGGDGHDERDEAVFAGAGRGLVVDEGVDEGERLLFVGLLVARHEEVVGQIGVSREVRSVETGGVGVHVVGLDHLIGAQDLDALVVAVGSLAAHVDDGLLAARVAHDDVGGVVGFRAREFGDFLVDVARAGREDFDRLRAHQVPRHVQIVDGHVLEDAAASFDVFERRRRGVARAQLDDDRSPEFARDDRLLDAREVRVEAALQSRHQLDAGLFARVDRDDRFRQVRRDGLFAEHGLALVGAPHDLLGVERRRRTDPHGLHVRMVDDLVRARGPLRHVM
mmetsp:Transcript_16506/g.49926  ORF Transcript_16506/g.49926 Transcript_16506/m.49926 type:complete len:401 (-) Transcript_16506:308-1510(-)